MDHGKIVSSWIDTVPMIVPVIHFNVPEHEQAVGF